jgi:hypothetical protein
VLTGDLDINSRYKLAKYFLQVLAGVKNEDIVRDPDGLLAPGQVDEIDFHLTEADIAADVILMAPARGSIDMTLVTPSGEVIDQTAALAMPGGLYYGGGAREGKWLARLQIGKRRVPSLRTLAFDTGPAAAAAVAQHGLPYSLLVHCYSNLRMATTLSQNGFAPGAKLLLRVVLTEYGVPVDRRATVTALVTEPGSVQRTVNLAETAPGVFDCDVQTTLAGTYDMRITARGRTLRNRAFTREAVRTGAVWIGGDRLPPSSSGGTDGRTNEVLCRLLHCALSERVIQPELRERLAAVGLDIDALLKCVGGACEQRSGRGGLDEALEQRLVEAVRAALALVDD